MPIDDDDKTPIEPWNLHPKATKVESIIPETGENVRTLEKILETVEKVLSSSKSIQEYGQKCAETAIKAVAEIPNLQARMTRVEFIAIGATLLNIAIFVVSCLRHH